MFAQSIAAGFPAPKLGPAGLPLVGTFVSLVVACSNGTCQLTQLLPLFRLAYGAFEEVLQRKQTQHVEVLEWLREQSSKCGGSL